MCFSCAVRKSTTHGHCDVITPLYRDPPKHCARLEVSTHGESEERSITDEKHGEREREGYRKTGSQGEK
jgi:hypothetical protein